MLVDGCFFLARYLYLALIYDVAIIIFCIRLKKPLHRSIEVKQSPQGPNLCLLPTESYSLVKQNIVRYEQ